MTDSYIGPFTISGRTHSIKKNNDFADETGQEKFQLTVPHSQAQQIRGLLATGKGTAYHNKVHHNDTSNGWGITPIKTSSADLNLEPAHEGWGLIRKMDIEPFSPLKSRITFTFDKLAPLTSYLTMSYTSGSNSGRLLNSNYGLVNEVDVFNDNFATYNTSTTWQAATEYLISPNSISASGNKLVFTGHSDGGDGIFAGVGSQSKNSFDAGTRLDFSLEWVRKPSQYEHELALYLTGDGVITWENLVIHQPVSDWIRVVIQPRSDRVVFAVQKWNAAGRIIDIHKSTLSSTQKTPYVRVKYKNQHLEVWVDKDWTNGTPTLTKIVDHASCGVVFNSYYYMVLGFGNRDSTGETMKCPFIKVYDSATSPYSARNVVLIPPCQTKTIGETTTRTGADGNFWLYSNPVDQLDYGINTSSLANYYVGTCKAYHGSQQLTKTEDKVVLDSFTMDNTIVKIAVNTDGIHLYKWDTTWREVNVFNLGGTIYILRIIEISPWKIKIQLNNTYWTIKMGKCTVELEHPLKAVGFTTKQRYIHDGVTLDNPDANPITMSTVPYCYIYNTADTYRLAVYKLNPTSIYRDSLPADSLTGLTVYKSTDTSYNAPDEMYKEWLNQTIQRVSIRP